MQIQSTPKRMNENYNPGRRITLEALHNRIPNLDIFIYIMRTLKVFFSPTVVTSTWQQQHWGADVETAHLPLSLVLCWRRPSWKLTLQIKGKNFYCSSYFRIQITEGRWWRTENAKVDRAAGANHFHGRILLLASITLFVVCCLP